MEDIVNQNSTVVDTAEMDNSLVVAGNENVTEVTEIKENVTEVKENVTEIEENVTEVKENVTKIEENVTEVKENVTEVKENVTEIEENVAEVKDNVTEIEENVAEIKENVTEIKENELENEIDEERMLSAIEAILFAMGGSVELSRISSVLELDLRKTKGFIKKLQERYESNDSGLMITQLENAVQMCTKPDLYEYLIKIAKQPRKYVLSESVMETLSIIAYKQPVTKAEIEKIRGVSCDHAVNKLVEFDLVEEVGRMDAPGRPLLFGTTEQFLRSFGVQSLEDLPLAGTDAVETFREQAEQEAQLKLDI